MINLLKQYGKVALSLAGILAVWWGVVLSGVISEDFFPSPYSVITAAKELYDDGILISDLNVSMGRAAIGFVIGVCLGVSIGLPRLVGVRSILSLQFSRWF